MRRATSWLFPRARAPGASAGIRRGGHESSTAPNKQPARFPLDTTMEGLADACGADAYRVYALDEAGTVIDYVTVEVGRELRNAGESEVMLMPSPRSSSGSSDLRYALESVAHMARTNADAMRAVAEPQAEWIKSISSARGLFRNNAAQHQLLAPTETATDEDEEEDERSAGPTGSKRCSRSSEWSSNSLSPRSRHRRRPTDRRGDALRARGRSAPVRAAGACAGRREQREGSGSADPLDARGKP